MNRKRSLLVLLAVGLIAIGAGVFVSQRQDAKAASGPSPAAEMFYQQSMRDATGATHAMSEHRGKVVVVNFWATWCVPCVKEIPAFSKVHADAGGKVAFVGLGIDSPDNIASFNQRFKPSYPLLAAGAGGTDLARAFGNESGALPFTVVLGPDGRVIASHLGQVDETTLKQWIAPYLEAGNSAGKSVTSQERSRT
jgi:thiol-disulfide isomerase/thioredoxin